jgi:hypothetical protein
MVVFCQTPSSPSGGIVRYVHIPITQLWLSVRQVVTNQYGRPDRASRGWGYGTIEGDLDDNALTRNRRDQNIDNANNQYRDQDYYASKEYDMGDIKVPILSVGVSAPILAHRTFPSREHCRYSFKLENESPRPNCASRILLLR